MSQSRDRRRNRRKYSRQPFVNKSTQTERERPTDQTPTINGSVILKITDYTKLDDNEQSSIDETSLSGTSSRGSAQSKARRQENAAINFRSGSSQTNKNWRMVGTYDLSSDSDDSANLNTISYDYLEGEPLVTSLTDLRLSDSDEDQQQLYLTEMTSNEEKLAKL